MREWMSIMKGILGGVITFIIITLVLEEFETELGEGAGASLIQVLVPLIVVLLILFHSFRGLEMR